MPFTELEKGEINKEHGVRHPALAAKSFCNLGGVRLSVTPLPDLRRRRAQGMHPMARPVVNADLIAYDCGVGRRRSTWKCRHDGYGMNADVAGSSGCSDYHRTSAATTRVDARRNDKCIGLRVGVEPLT